MHCNTHTHTHKHIDTHTNLHTHTHTHTLYLSLSHTHTHIHTAAGGMTAVMRLTKAMVDAGAAGIHFEDQRHGAKKCGHMGGKVLI